MIDQITCNYCKHYQKEGRCWLQVMRKIPADHARFRLSGNRLDCKYFFPPDLDTLSPEIIRAVRLSRGLSLEVFGYELCVSERTARRWEKEECKPNNIAVNAIKRFLKGVR